MGGIFSSLLSSETVLNAHTYLIALAIARAVILNTAMIAVREPVIRPASLRVAISCGVNEICKIQYDFDFPSAMGFRLAWRWRGLMNLFYGRPGFS
jgi:hypothetical protein